MKLTQHDIATIEQAHDTILHSKRLGINAPLMVKLRELSKRIYHKMDNAKDSVFVLSKKEIQDAYKEPEKLKEYAKDALIPNPEKNKWYKVEYLGSVLYVYITEFITGSKFKFFGFDNNGDFFNRDDGKIVPDAVYSDPDSIQLIDLFKKEGSKRGYANYDSVHVSFHDNGCKYRIDGKTVFKNGIWLDENTDINNLLKEAKSLEKKHGLKITLTFE